MLRIRLFRWEFPGGGFGFRPDWDSGSDQGRRGPVGLSCEDLRVYTCTTRPPCPHLAKGLGQCTPAHPSRQCGPRIGWVGPVFQGVDNTAHPKPALGRPARRVAREQNLGLALFSDRLQPRISGFLGRLHGRILEEAAAEGSLSVVGSFSVA